MHSSAGETIFFYSSHCLGGCDTAPESSHCLGGCDTAPESSSESVFCDNIYGDVVEITDGQLADMSKGCLLDNNYGDVVAATTQSSKVSQNHVFDEGRDLKTNEMTTSP